MTVAQRAFLIILSAVVMMIATAVLLQTGLPDRAQYTGQFVIGEGQYAPEVNAYAPLFDRPTVTGDNILLRDLRGKPVILNFWATWCEPCQREMPELQTLYEEFESAGLRIVAVNLGEPSEAVAGWTRAFGLTFDIVLDENRDLAQIYRLRGQPSTFILSPSGKITQIVFGQTDAQSLRAAIMPFLN